MSVVDEDTELRDLLVQTLDKNGVLGKIKAELRASIFLALEAQDQVKNPSSLSNIKLQNFLSKPNSSLCIDLIHEFFDFFGLDYSSAVFCPETNTTTTYKSPDSLRQRLQLPDDEESSILPVLASLIKNLKSSIPSAKLSKIQHERAQTLFTANLSQGAELLSVSTSVQVLSSLCPRFPLFLIERFVNEESKLHQSGLSISTFISMYEKLFYACHSVVTDEQNKDDITTSDRKKIVAGENLEESFAKQSVNFSNAPPRNTSLSSPEMTPASPQGHFFDDDYFKPKESPVKFLDTKATDSSKLPPLKESDKSSFPSLEKGDSLKDKSTTSDFDKRQISYEDDFNTSTQTSITEDLQVDSLLSSAHSSVAELTEDRTISEERNLKADYLEEIRQ